MIPVKIHEEKDRLEILLPLSGSKSGGTMLWILNAGLGTIFIVSFLMGLHKIAEGLEYLLPSIAILIVLGWTFWIGMLYWFGSEKIVLERNFISWQHNFVMYTSPINKFRWKSIEIYFLKEKKTKLLTENYGRLVFKTQNDFFKSLVVQDNRQSKMILLRIQDFFTKLKAESEREKDPVELLFPHPIFGKGKMWDNTAMLN